MTFLKFHNKNIVEFEKKYCFAIEIENDTIDVSK